MTFNSEQLDRIYERSSGYCHICHKKLARRNYGSAGKRGAWEVEHSNPRAHGGTDRLNNLYPACIPCNRSKGASSTKSARAKNGKARAPLSPGKRSRAKLMNGLGVGVLGAALGAIFGPVGMYVGGALGAHIGHRQNPDK